MKYLEKTFTLPVANSKVTQEQWDKAFMKETPFVCPKCEGLKKINNKLCPLCEGEGVIWKTSSPKVGDSFTKEIRLDEYGN